MVSAAPEAEDAAGVSRPGRKRTGIALLVLVIAAVAGIVAFAVYRDQIAPFRATVLIVDDAHIDMNYLINRVRMSGRPPLEVLRALSFEEIVKSIAPGPPYNIEVSDAGIDALLRESARDGGQPLSDAEFAEWYRQELNESGLTEAEHRDLNRTRLLFRGMINYLAADIPSSARQVRLSIIEFKTHAQAADAKARLDAGEDFATLAEELNGDPALKLAQGDIGWHAEAGLSGAVSRIVFELLAAGVPSEIVTLDSSNFVLLLVTDEAGDRPLEPEDLEAAQSAAFDEWIAHEFSRHKVEYHGFRNGFDSETDAWVRTQAAASQRGMTSAGSMPQAAPQPGSPGASP